MGATRVHNSCTRLNACKLTQNPRRAIRRLGATLGRESSSAPAGPRPHGNTATGLQPAARRPG
eukprot:1613668-Lingulodinium_polyedra.AAC.1